jgi:hypothetical protein
LRCCFLSCIEFFGGLYYRLVLVGLCLSGVSVCCFVGWFALALFISFFGVSGVGSMCGRVGVGCSVVC